MLLYPRNVGPFFSLSSLSCYVVSKRRQLALRCGQSELRPARCSEARTLDPASAQRALAEIGAFVDIRAATPNPHASDRPLIPAYSPPRVSPLCDPYESSKYR